MNQELVTVVERLSYILHTIPDLIKQIPAAEFSNSIAPGKWSKKQIVGHLLDSAVNNHHRFIRIQYENVPVIYYDQDKWNELSGYTTYHNDGLIDLWAMYNAHLIEVIKLIPEENLEREGEGRNGDRHSLKWYVTDYVAHMEHHLKQVVNY